MTTSNYRELRNARNHRLPESISHIPDQYVEVSGIVDGYYLLEFCADPFNEIEEEREDNNCATNHIRLSGMGTANKHVVVVPPQKR